STFAIRSRAVRFIDRPASSVSRVSDSACVTALSVVFVDRARPSYTSAGTADLPVAVSYRATQSSTSRRFRAVSLAELPPISTCVPGAVGGAPVHHWYPRATATSSATPLRMILFFDRRGMRGNSTCRRILAAVGPADAGHYVRLKSFNWKLSWHASLRLASSPSWSSAWSPPATHHRTSAL